MKENKIKKLISFDFDDTLVHTPLPNEGKKIWKEKTGEDWPHRGWWSKPESLDTEIFDIPLNKKIHKRYQQAIKDPDNYVILATGRIEPLKDEVYEILGDYGLSFDETHLNPGIDTFEFKSNLFAKLIYELQPEEFIMYDDRQEHLVRFVAWANAMPCKVTIIDAISGEEFEPQNNQLQEQVSRIKSMMGLINENIFHSEEFLSKKDELFNYLISLGMDANNKFKYEDINKDGVKDTLLTYFTIGNVILYAAICNFSSGDFQYLVFIKTKPNYEVLLKPTFVNNIEEIKNSIQPYIEQGYEDTKLDYLGIQPKDEYQISKQEYDDLLNKAIDDQDWGEVKRLQDKYGNQYY